MSFSKRYKPYTTIRSYFLEWTYDQDVYIFDNGYGASVLRTSSNGEVRKYEIALLSWWYGEHDIQWDVVKPPNETEETVFDDVDPDKIDDYLGLIEALVYVEKEEI